MSAIDPNARINLSKACVLLVDSSQHSVDMMAQIMKGFGVAEVTRCTDLDDARSALKSKAFDLVLIDPSVDNGAGYQFLNDLRHGDEKSNAFVPVILISGHARASVVGRARDTGANFVVAKPVTPNVLLQRILWVVRDKRPFVEIGKYIGPDRRFKFEGPPIGSEGRRENDLHAPLGSAAEPNLSQNEIDTMIKPQRVMI